MNSPRRVSIVSFDIIRLLVWLVIRNEVRLLGAVEDSLPAPARSDPAANHIDLLVRQHSAGALSKGRHGRSTYAVGDNLPHRRFIHDAQINRIGKRDGSSASSFRAVAT